MRKNRPALALVMALPLAFPAGAQTLPPRSPAVSDAPVKVLGMVTVNSARSAVYADGILLSNYLGNGVGGLGFPPRWGLVTPEEIERVDVMYGPFSAAYPGNSVGGGGATRPACRRSSRPMPGWAMSPSPSTCEPLNRKSP